MPYEKHLEGERVINFCLNDKDNNSICLDKIKSRWRLLFFFDKSSLELDNSEILYYSKAKDDFNNLKTELIGIGPVSEKEISKFCSEHDIQLILLSDVDYKVSEDYGVVYYDKEDNKKILPMTFLINKKSIFSRVWNRENMYYRYSGYGGNAIDLWEKGKMWGHISLVLDAIGLLDKMK